MISGDGSAQYELWLLLSEVVRFGARFLLSDSGWTLFGRNGEVVCSGSDLSPQELRSAWRQLLNSAEKVASTVPMRELEDAARIYSSKCMYSWADGICPHCGERHTETAREAFGLDTGARP